MAPKPTKPTLFILPEWNRFFDDVGNLEGDIMADFKNLINPPNITSWKNQEKILKNLSQKFLKLREVSPSDAQMSTLQDQFRHILIPIVAKLYFRTDDLEFILRQNLIAFVQSLYAASEYLGLSESIISYFSLEFENYLSHFRQANTDQKRSKLYISIFKCITLTATFDLGSLILKKKSGSLVDLVVEFVEVCMVSVGSAGDKSGVTAESMQDCHNVLKLCFLKPW
ncbi:hypothetical protein BKA69DRAFT_1044676 [Paraphysoderma sedebokerense]|nr:hypothetical protein BKA69DRAFT_1044676 [Paraphysoderma sedebokerense]